MKIGLFTDQYYPYVSGVVTSISMLAEALTSMGHSVYIFTSIDEKKIEDKEHYKSLNIINLPGHNYPFKQLRDYRFSFSRRRAVKTIKTYNLDIIHIHTEYSVAKDAIKAGKKLSIPIVHTFHTLFEDYLKYFSKFLDKHFHKLLMKVLRSMFIRPVSKASIIEIVPTKKVLGVTDKYGISGDIRVIPTGIELDRYYIENIDISKISRIREKLGIPRDKFVFTYIGRTSKEKNISTILQAYAKICHGTNSILVIVGGGPELDDLKQEVKSLQITDYVIFTGWIPQQDVNFYYHLGDVFVNASHSETQGLTYIEALASSLPVLVQKDDAIIDLISDYYNGFYFDGVNELALKMEEILKAPNTLKKIKQNTKKSVANFSKLQYANNVLAVYEDAIEKYKKGK